MNLFGLLIGAATLFIIGLGFVWVIQGERHLGYLWWPYFMGLGFLLALGSVFVPTPWGSALLGVFGSSLIWGATEFKDQTIRAELGWFPFKEKKLRPPLARIIARWKTPHL